MKDNKKNDAGFLSAEEEKWEQKAADAETVKETVEDETDDEIDELSEAEAKKAARKEKGKVVKQNVMASFSTRKFRGGAYATALSAIVLVVMLLVNLIIGSIDLKIDVTSQNQYTMSDETKEFLKDIDTDITIYYLVQSGGEVQEFVGLIEKYETYGKNIKVVYKDPVQYPKFATEYTDETVSQNSLIVVNNENGRAKYVDYSDMIISEFSYTSYSYEATATDVEGQVTSAISYVINEELPVVYAVTGHGETAIGSSVSAILAKENITLNSLDTLTVETIPEDCDILLINSPTRDLTTDEVVMIQTYLRAGGNAMFYAGYGCAGLSNYCSLIEDYGVGVIDGLVFEGSSSHFMGQYANMIIPNVQSHEITDSFANSKYVIAANASGLELVDGARTTIEIAELLTTSNKAYSKVGDTASMSTIEKEDGDIDGPFALGYYAVETYNEVVTKVAVYASYSMIDDSIASYSTFANADLLINTINAITEQENSLYIPTVSLTADTVTLNSGQANTWTAIYVVVIPVALIAAGIVVVVRRRKK